MSAYEAYKYYSVSMANHAHYHEKMIEALDTGNHVKALRYQRLGAVEYNLMTSYRNDFIKAIKNINKEYRKNVSFGMAFHTDMRKNVDTKWSVVLWNMIHVLCKNDKEVWINFCSICQEYYEMGFEPSDCAVAWAKDNKWKHHKDGQWFSSHEYHTFLAMIELVDEQTWNELNASFAYYEKEENE
jgi:hypothetical protein